MADITPVESTEYSPLKTSSKVAVSHLQTIASQVPRRKEVPTQEELTQVRGELADKACGGEDFSRLERMKHAFFLKAGQMYTSPTLVETVSSLYGDAQAEKQTNQAAHIKEVKQSTQKALTIPYPHHHGPLFPLLGDTARGVVHHLDVTIRIGTQVATQIFRRLTGS